MENTTKYPSCPFRQYQHKEDRKMQELLQVEADSRDMIAEHHRPGIGSFCYKGRYWHNWKTCHYLFFFILFYFLQRGREGEREGEKHQCVIASFVPPTGDLACNPGMCPDWELNQRPFGSHTGTQSTKPHQPGQKKLFVIYLQIFFQFEIVD